MTAAANNSSNTILSVVIPTWNRELEVVRALDSILPLLRDYREIELVVSDNASHDGTVRVVRDWLNLHKINAILLESDLNVGPVLNWIKGIRSASGYYVMLLFSDDLLDFDTRFSYQYLVDTLYKLAPNDVKLIRLPVQIVDDNLRPSPNKLINLPYPSAINHDQFFELSSTESFLLNHLLPRRTPWINIPRSFSPVSPAGYIVERDSMLTTLKRYCNRHSYKQNGAGIDQLAILCAARDSSEVAFLRSPTSLMVASQSSITHNSSRSAQAAHNLAISYYVSQLHFSKESLWIKKTPLYLIFLIISLMRLSKQYCLRVISR